MQGRYEIIDNYIYIYQLGVYIIIPVYPEQITDNLGSTFATENILARTAPVYSYSNSGPRTVPITIKLHRDLLNSVNATNLSFLDEVSNMLKEDYVDTLVRYLQAMALPTFSASLDAYSTYSSMLNPPMIALRIGKVLFIKGIINGEVQVSYSGAIDSDGKYSEIEVSFTVTEVDPQDAEQIAEWGSSRGAERLLTKGLYKN